MQQEEELLKVQDVAERLQVNARTVLRMVVRGELDAVRVARNWRFRPRDIDAYLRKQHFGPAVVTQVEGLPNDDITLGSANGEPQIPLTRLDIEQRRLELEKEQWDLATRRFNYILETSQKMIDSSDIDEKTKSKYKTELLESLLPQLLELGKGRGSDHNSMPLNKIGEGVVR